MNYKVLILKKKKKNRKKTEKFESETEEEEETAQEKSVRLAKKYLQEIEEEGMKKTLYFI